MPGSASCGTVVFNPPRLPLCCSSRSQIPMGQVGAATARGDTGGQGDTHKCPFFSLRVKCLPGPWQQPQCEQPARPSSHVWIHTGLCAQLGRVLRDAAAGPCGRHLLHCECHSPELLSPAGHRLSHSRSATRPAALSAPQEFLKKEFSAENVYFWQACERFQQIPASDTQQVPAPCSFGHSCWQGCGHSCPACMSRGPGRAFSGALSRLGALAEGKRRWM